MQLLWLACLQLLSGLLHAAQERHVVILILCMSKETAERLPQCETTCNRNTVEGYPMLYNRSGVPLLRLRTRSSSSPVERSQSEQVRPREDSVVGSTLGLCYVYGVHIRRVLCLLTVALVYYNVDET